MSENMFEPGDKVLWLFTSSRGWNEQKWVRSTVVKTTPKRVVIDIELNQGGTVRRTVKPELLKPRATNYPTEERNDDALSIKSLHSKHKIMLRKMCELGGLRIFDGDKNRQAWCEDIKRLGLATSKRVDMATRYEATAAGFDLLEEYEGES